MTDTRMGHVERDRFEGGGTEYEEEGTTERISPLSKFFKKVMDGAIYYAGDFHIYEGDCNNIEAGIGELEQALRELGEFKRIVYEIIISPTPDVLDEYLEGKQIVSDQTKELLDGLK